MSWAIVESGGDVRVWDTASGNEVRSIAASSWVNAIALSRDGKYLATAGDNETVKLWDLAGGGLYQTLLGHNGSVRAMVFSPDSRRLATLGLGMHGLTIWDATEPAR